MSIYEKTNVARALLYWAKNNNGNEAYYLEERMYAAADNGMVILLTADSYDEMLKTLGLGYRAFSGYIRNGVSEVITLQGDLHTERELLHFSNSKAELIDRIIPYLDSDLDSKEAIKKIRDIISGEE